MSRVVSVALLLFGSGFCALIFQAVWLRQFRLVFGASTLASAAVLAVFMGGLGLGAWRLGRHVDRSPNPLAFYGFLEVGVALSVALTPLFLWVVRSGYLAIGGSFALGPFFATIIRLALTVLVLGIPTFLMGGTLPAAARAVERSGDAGRIGVSAIYAANTFGAVGGVLLSTFYLLEHFGNFRTLLFAVLLNLFVALTALLMSNRIRRPVGRRHARTNEIEVMPEAGESIVAGAEVVEGVSDVGQQPVLAPRVVYVAAATVGFAFLLMELVWYRMLTPLLGGTTYTFGLILAVALFGIGAGSMTYTVMRRERATAAAFALCCAFEALFIALPFALGDRLALLALLLRPIGAVGFGGFVLGWTAIAAIVILPASFIAGIQIPLLISLLGEGRADVGRHVGVTYAWNTMGAITGSLAGGFGLLPLLTAPGAWRVVVVVLVALSVFVTFSSGVRLPRTVPAMLVAAAALALLLATGPTAFWRHTPIGTGRADMTKPTRNQLIDLMHLRRRTTVWEAEGVESSVSVADSDGYAFIVNGKGDGHSRLDAGTQVMGGVLAALLHPEPRSAAVVGLGTGSTAGWLAAIPTIERVDAVEIEPSILHVAELSTPVNHAALSNPKLTVHIGDGREFLLVRGRKYDVISSEPSNPYRAGIANLFTTEFYRACLSRLNEGGIFIQFLQAYEIDAQTVRTIYATITDVFPHVETWQSLSGDLLLVGALEPLVYDKSSITQRIAIPPVRDALAAVWWAFDADDVLARYVAGPATAKVLAQGMRRNTDDRAIVEYAFARTLGRFDSFDVGELRQFALRQSDDLPAALRGRGIDTEITLRRASMPIAQGGIPQIPDFLPNELRLRAISQLNFIEGAYSDVWTLWQAQTVPPQTPLETLTLAMTLANRGDESAIPYIDALRRTAPVEASSILGRLRYRQGRVEEAAAHFEFAFRAYRSNPWPLPMIMQRALTFINEISDQPHFAQIAPRVADALSEPFAVHLFEELRRSTLLLLAQRAAGSRCSSLQMDLLKSYEPHVPWQQPYLTMRAGCYRAAGDPLADRAERDLESLLRHERKGLYEN